MPQFRPRDPWEIPGAQWGPGAAATNPRALPFGALYHAVAGALPPECLW